MQVLSPSGVKLALRYEMRQPFANWVVHQVSSACKLAADLELK